MRGKLGMAGAALIVGTLGIAGSPQAATIAISCAALGEELRLCQEGANAWAKETGNSVQVVSVPNSATERLAVYQQIMAAGSADIDVFTIDVVWPGMLAPHLIDLSLYIDQEVIDQHFPAIVANNTINGELVAMPWFTNAGVLYYRTDLLEQHGVDVPTTWHELTDVAATVMEAERAAGSARMQGFVFQAKAYEGLTCNALEWVDSFGGGTIIDEHGNVTINNPEAAEALDLAATWIGQIAPRGVLTYAEEEARGVFQSGNAVFMRN